MKPVIVKIGGSVVAAGRLAAVLDVVARAARPTVIVTGGGPFADAVRAAQDRLGFSELAAHRMAILAMHQTAEIALAEQPELVPVETLGQIWRAHESGRVGVWLPARMTNSDRRLGIGWSVTSDALAARLAERMKADVILVKSRAVPQAASADDLAAEDIVDPVFPKIVARAGLDWRVLPSDDLARLMELLAGTGTAKPSGPQHRT